MPEEIVAQDPLADPLVLVVMFFGGIMVIGWFFFKKKGQLPFKAQSVEKLYRKDLMKILKLLGEKKSRNFLRQGYHKIGKILKMTSLKVKITVAPETKKQRKKTLIGEFFLFMTREPNIVGKIKAFLGITDLFLVDIGFIEKELSEDYHINEGTQLQLLENIGIFSNLGKLVLEGIAWKHAYNQTLESAVNQASRVVYLEVAHAKFVSKAEKIAGIESKRYSTYLEGIGEK